MSEIMIHIKDVYHQENHTILINEDSIIQHFINQVLDHWNIEDSDFDHQMYSKDLQMILDSCQSWKDNQVVNGDHILLF